MPTETKNTWQLIHRHLLYRKSHKLENTNNLMFCTIGWIRIETSIKTALQHFI